MEPSDNHQHRILVAGLIFTGLIIVAIFGFRTIQAFRGFREHRPRPPLHEPVETDVSLIRDWMTVPFISRMYRVPPDFLFQALEIPEQENRGKSLKQLNEKYYPDQPGYVLTIVKATVQANLPPPTPLPADTPVPPASPIPPASP